MVARTVQSYSLMIIRLASPIIIVQTLKNLKVVKLQAGIQFFEEDRFFHSALLAPISTQDLG